MGQVSINALFWVDDLVLMGKSEEHFKALVKTLEEYCDANELTINTKNKMHDF